MKLQEPKDILHKGIRLSEILDAHNLWRNGEGEGERAFLVGANLSEANLNGVSLVEANLNAAFLVGANLSEANLNGVSLVEANLSEANLNEAFLVGANLNETFLVGANLSEVNLNGTTGNMREIKSAQLDRWELAWTTAPDGIVTLQIGCKKHSLDLWEKSDPRWIAALDSNATEWWTQYRDIVLSLVKACPATPWGTRKEKETK